MKAGHSAARCLENPHRESKRRCCGKLGHVVASCWTKEVGDRISLIEGEDSGQNTYYKEEAVGKNECDSMNEIGDENFSENQPLAVKRSTDGQALTKDSRRKKGHYWRLKTYESETGFCFCQNLREKLKSEEECRKNGNRIDAKQQMLVTQIDEML